MIRNLQSPIFRSWIFIAICYVLGWLWLAHPEVETLTGDASGYYQYLPALVLHDEIEDPRKSAALRHAYLVGQPLPEEIPPHPTGKYIENGNMVIKYTIGLAILESPFFALGHITAAVLGEPTDGFSSPYGWWISFGKICYVLLGLWWLGLVLRQYVDEKIAIATLLLTALATNLFFFTGVHQPMSHPFLFMLYSGLLLATQRWHERATMRMAVAIGVSAGMIILIRPTEIICLIIPLAYGLGSIESIPQRLERWQTHWQQLLVAVAVFALCAIPQLIYWKYVSGLWLFYSYGEEGFDFASPEILNGIFSYKNGWFVYTPAMVFALIGVGLLLFRKKERLRAWLWPILVFTPIHIYITYSWWCWNYINGFGSRPMVQAYAVLSIPLAAFLFWANKQRLLRAVVVILGLAFISLNLFQTWQFRKGILFSEDANEAYYWEIFGTTQLSKQDLLAFDTNDFHPTPDAFTPTKQLYQYTFDDSLNDHFERSPLFRGEFSYRLDWGEQYGAYTPHLRAGDVGLTGGEWLKIGIKAWQPPGFRPTYEMASLAAVVNRQDSNVHYQAVRINNKIGGPPYELWGNVGEQWDEVYYFFQMPANLQKDDVLKVFCWNPYQHPVYVDDMEVWLCE